jgi:hypothetical protein
VRSPHLAFEFMASPRLEISANFIEINAGQEIIA